MSPIQDPVLQFTLLVTAALLAQLTVERARVPGLLGLLALGVLLGPGGFEVLRSRGHRRRRSTRSPCAGKAEPPYC